MLGLVTGAFPKLSAQTFSSSISLSPSSVGTSVAQDTRHLSFSRYPHLCRFDPSTPIPNGTDTCQTFRALLTIPDVPIRLSTDTPEIVPGPYQPVRICAYLARFVDPRSERLEIFTTRGDDLDDQNEDDGLGFCRPVCRLGFIGNYRLRSCAFRTFIFLVSDSAGLTVHAISLSDPKHSNFCLRFCFLQEFYRRMDPPGQAAALVDQDLGAEVRKRVRS